MATRLGSIDRTDRASPLPMYFQIALDLRRRIAEGEFTAGQRITSEVALAREYEVSRVTLRQALAELEKDDLLERRRGSGTFVRERRHPLVYELDFTTGALTTRLRAQGFALRADVVDTGLIDAPAPDLRQRLGLTGSDRARVIYLVRRVIVDDEPAAVYRSWFSADLVPGIERSDGLEGSLAEVLAEDYGLAPDRSENDLEVVRGTSEEVALLGTTVDVPLVVVTATTFLPDGRPLEYYRMTWLGDRVRFHVTARDERPSAG